MANNKTDKNIKKGLSIREQLFLVSFIVVLLTSFLGAYVFYFLERIKDIDDNYAQILTIDDCIKKMTFSESVFLLKESSQPDFYIDENVNSVVTFKGYANKLNILIDELSEASKIKKSEADSLNTLSHNFELLFDSLLVLIKNRGFKDYGLIGKMRVDAHEIENIVSNLGNNLLYVKMLQLRRNEKDYFLRKDPAYVERFENNAMQFIMQVELSEIDNTLKETLISKTRNYQSVLKKIMVIDELIGYTSSNGLLKQIEVQRDLITQLNEEITQAFSEFQTKEIKNVKIQFSIILLIIIIALFLFIRKIRQNISVPFNDIKNSLQSLSLGIIPKTIEEKRSSREIREITRVLNKIFQGLQNMIQFAGSLHKGIFDQPFEPLSDKDELGNALIEMQNGLETAKKERKKRQEEESRQSWINKGTAEFAEVINQNFSNIEDFSFSIISRLVKYLDANQGGFYVLNNEDETEPYLELIAVFAYNRKKYANARIELGEGFVGSSVLENNIIYRTEIPEDYISITSGLGGSNPRVLLIVPLILDEEKFGALEIASFNKFENYKLEFIKTISESITTTMSSIRSREKTQKLLEQTQAQAEQIIQAEEEMRQNLEEMQATQEESTRREEKLRQDLEDARKKIVLLENQINNLSEERED